MRPRRNNRLRLLIYVFLLIASATTAYADDTTRIGVLAMEGNDTCLETWHPTAQFLDSRIAGTHFEIVPVDFDTIIAATVTKSVDYVLANSSTYARLEVEYGVRRIATLIRHAGVTHQSRFGGVLFVRNSHNNVRNYEDLRGFSLAAVDRSSFGGYLAVVRELTEYGVRPEKFFSAIQFAGTHEAIIEAVIDGKEDAGIVRTGVIERLITAGKIEKDSVRPISLFTLPKDSFAGRYSTRLYPEWPIVALEHTDDEQSRLVAQPSCR